MLISIKEINENKRFIALFSNGKTTKFGQTNSKTGTYIDHQDKLKKNKLYQASFERFKNK